MIGALVALIIYVIVLSLLWWLVNYILNSFPLPDPADRLVRVAVTIIIVLAAIFLLLGLFGVGGIEGVPRFRFG
jgi:hypothetical protein